MQICGEKEMYRKAETDKKSDDKKEQSRKDGQIVAVRVPVLK